jgi:hypothetical protein
MSRNNKYNQKYYRDANGSCPRKKPRCEEYDNIGSGPNESELNADLDQHNKYKITPCENPKCDHLSSSRKQIDKPLFNYIKTLDQLIELGWSLR